MSKYIFADARHTWYWSSIRQLSNFCYRHETDIWNGRGDGVKYCQYQCILYSLCHSSGCIGEPRE